MVYLFQGKILIPAFARTKAGFFMGMGPVEVVDAKNVGALEQALERIIRIGNPIVPNPRGGKALPKDPVLQHAGVKSLAVFEKNAQLWSIECKKDTFEIVPHRRRPDRSFEEISGCEEILSRRVGVEGIAQRIVALESGLVSCSCRPL